MSFFFGSTAKKSVPPKVFVPQNKLKSTSAPSSQSASETAHSAKEGETPATTVSSSIATPLPPSDAVPATTSTQVVDEQAVGVTIQQPAKAQPVKIGIGVGASRGFAPNVASQKPSVTSNQGAASSAPSSSMDVATGQKRLQSQVNDASSVNTHRAIPTPSVTTMMPPAAAPSLPTEGDEDDDQLGRGKKRRKANTPSLEVSAPAVDAVSSNTMATATAASAPATGKPTAGGTQSTGRASNRKRNTTAAAATTASTTPLSSSSSSAAHLLPVHGNNNGNTIANTARSGDILTAAASTTAPSSSSGTGSHRRSSSHHGGPTSKALRKIERPLFPLAAYGPTEKFSRHTVYVRLPAPGLNGIEGIRLTNVDDRAVVTAIQPITPQTPVALKYLHQIELYDIVLAVNHLDARYASFDQILMALGRTQSAPVGVQDTYVLDDGRQVSGRELLLSSSSTQSGTAPAATSSSSSASASGYQMASQSGLDPLGAGLGLGSVGSGVWALLQSQASLNGIPGVIARGSLKNATIDSIARVVFARMPRNHPHSPVSFIADCLAKEAQDAADAIVAMTQATSASATSHEDHDDDDDDDGVMDDDDEDGHRRGGAGGGRGMLGILNASRYRRGAAGSGSGGGGMIPASSAQHLL